ncbi:response regulator [Nocardia sp. NPDC004168]|uniref:response regulator n=1 Tax=Nocardia sp. NPDC004168 TaxID=3154452 RepID=UPI0033A41843
MPTSVGSDEDRAMEPNLRVLVASPLGGIIAPVLSQYFPASTVAVASDVDEVRGRIVGRFRFDVVISDLIWNKPEMEHRFDGLDVLDLLRETKRQSEVLLAAQGHSMESDHLDEARLRADEIAEFYDKSSGVPALLDAIQRAATGRSDQVAPPPQGPPALCALFTEQRGETAGRLAGAIAAKSAWDYNSLAQVARVGLNTANKATNTYIGPIILARKELPEGTPLTQGAVFRWCGEHAHYLISWCRRNGHADVLGPRFT